MWDGIDAGLPPPEGMVCQCGGVRFEGFEHRLMAHEVLLPHIVPVEALSGVKDGRCEKCGKALDAPPHKGAQPCLGGVA